MAKGASIIGCCKLWGLTALSVKHGCSSKQARIAMAIGQVKMSSHKHTWQSTFSSTSGLQNKDYFCMTMQ
jgi:hypothetical protein